MIFNARDIISYSDFKSFIESSHAYFLREKFHIFTKYNILKRQAWDGNLETYTYFRKEYRQLVQGIIEATIKKYRKYLPKNCLIAQFGSIPKTTDRILSDIDFTICYDEPKSERYECAEMLINYSLSRIFDISIDHIHGKFQHYPKICKFEQLTEKDNLYQIQFNEYVEQFKCGPETFIENLTNIKNVRDYSSLLKGYKVLYESHNNFGCLFSINIIENSTVYDLIADLSNLEKENDICDGYQFCLEDYELKDKFQISEIKTLLKKYTMVQFYFFFVKLRKIIKLSKSYSMNIDDIWENKVFRAYYGNEFVDALRRVFISFLVYWNRLELTLYKRKLALSTRCYRKVSLAEINNWLQLDWGNTTCLENLIQIRNTLVRLLREKLSEL